MAVFTTIDDPGLFYNTVLYTGNGVAYGSGGNAITGVGFQPDFTWIKSRTTGEEHVLTDSVRGVTKIIRINGNYVETTATEGLNVFGSDGFTIGSSDQFNTNTEDYASWNLKAGTTSVPSGGSITPTAVSLNTTSGFSIIAYGGASTTSTIAHGLGVAPKYIIIKGTSNATNWQVGSTPMDTTWNYVLYFNLTHAKQNEIMFGDTAPTSTLFSLGNAGETNATGRTYIAYVFAEVQGYSKMGAYEGTGDADGPFVYTGMRPAWVMIKRWDLADNWMLFDSKREGFNPDNDVLLPNDTATETTTDYIDILSNGFKLRSADAAVNASAGDYTFMAFAESPLVNSEGAPTNAR